MGAGGMNAFPGRLRGVIFDCDGVIIDSCATNGIFYNRILAYFGLPPMTPEQEQYCFMATALESLHYLLPPELHSQIDYVTRHVVNYQRDIMPLLVLYPGFRDMVLWLHGHGVRMAVDTNRTQKGIERVLDIFGMSPYFNPVVGADRGMPPKPCPDGAKFILKQWGLAPEAVLFVGDSQHDRDAAVGAGIPFAAFGNRSLSGDVVAADYAALREILGPSVE